MRVRQDGADPTRAGEAATAAVLAAVAASIFVETAGYPASLVPGAPGPAFFPRFLAVILGLLAVLLAVRAFRRDGEAASAPVGSEGAAGRITAVFLMVVVFLAAVGALGFFVLLPPLLAGVMAVMGERRIGALLAVPLLFDLFVYVVFYRLFSVDLPTLLL